MTAATLTPSPTAAASATPPAAGLADAWTNLLAWADAKWTAFEGDVSSFVNTEVPILEADVVALLNAFGEDLIGDAVTALGTGSTPGATASSIVTSLVQKVEAQGAAIVISTAQTAASQIVTAAQAKLGTLVGSTTAITAAP